MEDTTYNVDQELKLEFIDESLDLFPTLDGLFVQLEERPDDLEIINAIFRPIHTIKGNSSFFNLMKVTELSHEMETLLDLMRSEKLAATKRVTDILLAGVDMLRSILERARRDEPELADEKAFSEFIEVLKRLPTEETSSKSILWQRLLDGMRTLKEAAAEAGVPHAEDIGALLSMAERLAPDTLLDVPAETSRKIQRRPVENEPEPVKTATETSRKQLDSAKTMRVAEAHVDKFLEFVGELVVLGEMFRHIQIRLTNENTDHDLITQFRRVNETFANLSMNLQKSVMEIRKVPVQTILRKVPRMVRDVAEASGKEIAAVIEGQDVEVDKSLMDVLEPCLTHMVRNAADHGIEMPDIREAAGKSRKGTTRVAVTETPDHVFLTVSDDGKGIDYDAVRAKAVALGLLKSDRELTEDVITDILFAPGLSTAEKVTDVSGRGVGMDVVKRSVDALGGRVSVTSSRGAGSEFRVQVPKSINTQIVSGLVVEVAGERYVMPLQNVQECFCPLAEEVHSVLGNGNCVMRHGKSLPVIWLPLFFAGRSAGTRISEGGVMVVVVTGKQQFAVYVNGVIGVRQVVLKKVEGLQAESQLFGGGALMGDGKVAMFLDVKGICSHISEAGINN